MIELKIIGFRCYREITLKIHEGEMTLLSGPSGIGKSTIMAAIGWCLFGNKVHRGVDTIGSDDSKAKGKLSVTLQYQNYKIRRQKRPNMFTVLVASPSKTEEYTSEDAEAIVASVFCHPSLWNIVGCIPQNETHRLLSSSNTARMEYLNKLAFDDFDPTAQIATINSELQKINIQRQFLTASLEKEAVLLQREAETHQNKKLLSPELTEEYAKIVNSASSKLSSLLQIKVQSDFAKERLLQYQAQLKQCIQQKESYSLPTNFTEALKEFTALIESTSKRYQDTCVMRDVKTQKLLLWRSNQSLLQQYQQYQKELTGDRFADLAPLIGSLPIVSQEKIVIAKMQEQRHFHFLKICQSHGLDYSMEAIQKEKEHLIKWQKSQSLRQLQQEVQARQIEFAKLIPPKRSSQQLLQDKKEIDSQVALTYSLRDIKLCPSCNKTLRILPSGQLQAAEIPNGTELHKIENSITEYQNSLLRINQDYSMAVLYENKEREFKELHQKLLTMTANSPDINLSIAAPKIPEHILNALEMVELPNPSSHTLMKILEYTTLQNKIEQLSKCLPSDTTPYQVDETNYDSLLSSLQQELNALNLRRNNLLSVHTQVEKLESQIAMINQEITKLSSMVRPEITSEIEEYKTQIDRHKKAILDSEDCKKFNSKVEKYNASKQELIAVSRKYSQLLRMKEIAISCECAMLYEIVNALNVTVNNIAAYLFDSPITITLTLHKQLKTEDRKVQAVHVDINYKGMKIDSIASLSGGERDRVSLCLTLAANSISGCPLLLLDEMVSSLHEEGSTTAIKSISKASAGKTCLVIAHNAIEGHFRDVIDLRNYSQCFV